MKLEVGDLVLFHGRLAEVLRAGDFHGPGVVEVTDEGGIRWDYILGAYPSVSPLQLEGECVLDAIARAAAQELTPAEQLQRMGELWLSDPQVGDVFLVEDGYLLELTEFWDDGTILATKHTYKPHYPMKSTSQTGYQHARQLRQWLKLPNIPVYRAAAFATKRRAFEGHELLNSPPPSSPLLPVKGK